MSEIPIVRTLAVCTRESKKDARTELKWNIGIAFVPVLIVAFAVIFTSKYSDIPKLLFDQVGRGELMVYAAAICGPVLYALRFNMKEAVPESIASQVTPIGTLTGVAGVFMVLAMASYLIRRLSDLHTGFPLNEGLLYIFSWVVLILTIILAYVVFALKHSLGSGFGAASREQTADFKGTWIREGRE